MKFGVAGVLLLILAYVAFIFSFKLFIILNAIATFLLFLHSIKIKDKVFIIVNGWILIILLYKVMHVL